MGAANTSNHVAITRQKPCSPNLQHPSSRGNHNRHRAPAPPRLYGRHPPGPRLARAHNELGLGPHPHPPQSGQGHGALKGGNGGQTRLLEMDQDPGRRSFAASIGRAVMAASRSANPRCPESRPTSPGRRNITGKPHSRTSSGYFCAGTRSNTTNNTFGIDGSSRDFESTVAAAPFRAASRWWPVTQGGARSAGLPWADMPARRWRARAAAAPLQTPNLNRRSTADDHYSSPPSHASHSSHSHPANLPRQDLNLNQQSQSLLCYRYTTG